MTTESRSALGALWVFFLHCVVFQEIGIFFLFFVFSSFQESPLPSPLPSSHLSPLLLSFSPLSPSPSPTFLPRERAWYVFFSAFVPSHGDLSLLNSRLFPRLQIFVPFFFDPNFVPFLFLPSCKQDTRLIPCVHLPLTLPFLSHPSSSSPFSLSSTGRVLHLFCTFPSGRAVLWHARDLALHCFCC